MINLFMKIFNERLVQDIINNFDPYEIKMNTDIELNKKYNEEPRLNHKEK